MRSLRTILPVLLAALGLPALALPPAPATHRVQALRTGAGEPHIRYTSVGRPAPALPRQAEPTVRTRPYRPGAVGEGAAKN